MANTAHAHAADAADETRRDFLLHTTAAMGVVGAGMMVWPLISSMNPAADTLALSSIELSLAGIAEGQRIKALWRGKPVFVSHRTAQEIDEARKVNVAELRDPQTDQVRAKKPEFLIVVGVCTHFGCVPQGTASTEVRGEFGGWFCPCHGSVYDTSGRIRRGPAPLNLEVPAHTYINDTTVRIG